MRGPHPSRPPPNAALVEGRLARARAGCGRIIRMLGSRGIRRRCAVAVDFEHLGPAEGELFPGLALRGIDGKFIDLHADRAGRPALVVFYRSARW